MQDGLGEGMGETGNFYIGGGDVSKNLAGCETRVYISLKPDHQRLPLKYFSRAVIFEPLMTWGQISENNHECIILLYPEKTDS